MYPIWHPYSSAQDNPPLFVKRAYGSKIELEDGKVVIDACGSWWTQIFGHSYLPLVQVLQKQAEELDHVLFGSVTHDPAVKVATHLVSILGSGKVIFSDNGSTAVEIAMKLACHLVKLRKEAERTLFVSFEGAYHGDTIGTMSLQSKGVFTDPYISLLRQGVQIPFVETWHEDDTVERREAEAIVKIEAILQKIGKKIIAFVFEPLLQGSGGMKICRPEFLQKVTLLMKTYGILLIADEVLTGLGRTGEFLACTKAGISWNILALSKGLTGGMLPLAITFLKKELFDEFYQKEAILFHGHTFTANPIACRVAEKTLELLNSNPKCFQDFERRYQVFLPKSKQRFIRVRTLGCMWGGDLPYYLSYGSAESLYLRKLFLEKGILCRPLGSVIYFFPAYTISDEELDFCFHTLFSLFPIIKGEA